MHRRAFLQNTAAGVASLSFGAPDAMAAAAKRVIVYGGTAAGVAAAVAAARGGAQVALIEPGRHLGGMVCSGLGHSDIGKKETIGGIAREFFHNVGRHYGQEVCWDFEPHVAEDVLKKMASDAGVKVFYDRRLKAYGGVAKRDGRVVALTTEDGTPFAGQVFVDASYEGDLMAQAGVSFTWGREGRDEYGESYAGVQAPGKYTGHRFEVPVSAYDANGGLLPDILTAPRGALGAGDKKIQAYNFRLCLTKDRANQIPYPEPGRYDARRYQLLARYIVAETARLGRLPWLMIVSQLPNGKTDINNYGAFSTDYINGSWEYPMASYRRRAELWIEHADYIRGFFHFLTSDPQVPGELSAIVREWGLAADEFADTEHWPFQLYVREGRRMVGEYVMRQSDLGTMPLKDDVIGMGSYTMDSHNVQRFLQDDGTVQNEGDIQVPSIPFQIPYRAILPRRSECRNLLVPVCASATHVAYGSLRLEPVYMILGEAAGVAAAMAAGHGADVQGIASADLTAELVRKGTVTRWSNPEHLQLMPLL
jgi:hypothetical protein